MAAARPNCGGLWALLGQQHFSGRAPVQEEGHCAKPRSCVCGGAEHANEGRGNIQAQHLARGGRLVGRRDRPDPATASLGDRDAHHARHRGGRDFPHGDPRRAADRRDRGLRNVPGAARGHLRRFDRARLQGPARDAADRDQSQMGARRDGGGGSQPPAWRARGRRLCARRRDQRGGYRRQPGDRPPWRGADRGDRGEKEAGRAGQHPHPLQCRMARRRRRRHRDGADLHRARQGRGGPCVGGRNASAQPGRLAHRLGAQSPRRSAPCHRRQHRRPPDAARAGRHGDRGHRPGDAERRRLQQDRHLSQGARGARQRGAVLCRAAVADDRFHGSRRARYPDRGARRRRGRHHDGADRRRPHRDGAGRPAGLAGRQLRIRRDAGAARHRPDHRARRDRGDARGVGQAFPERASRAARRAAE